MQLTPDSALRRAALEVESHVAERGWDQPPRLLALVRTAALIAAQPELADQLGDPEDYTPVEQDGLPVDRSFEEALEDIEWPATVDGCAAVLERVMLPPEAQDGLPDDPDQLREYAATHPLRREVRLVAAVLRDGSAHCTVRARSSQDAPLLEGPDLVPGLVELLRGTLT